MSPASTRAMSIASSPNGLPPGRDQRVPQRRRRSRIGDELEAELTREPRPQDGRLHAPDTHRFGVEAEVAERGQIEVREPLHQVTRRRTGGRDHRQLLGPAHDPRVQSVGGLAEPVLEPCRVDHDPELLVGVLVDVAVVDHQPVGVHERAVAHLPGSDPRQVVREPPLDQTGRIRTRHLVLHRREQVPQPGRRADGLVLVARGVAHRHGPGPAVLPDDLRSRGDLDVVQRRAALFVGHLSSLPFVVIDASMEPPQTFRGRQLLGRRFCGS